MQAPTNPAYLMSPTHFQHRSCSPDRDGGDVQVPPVTVFRIALSPEMMRSTGFLPRHIPPSNLSTVHFSEANMKWIQFQIVARIARQYAVPSTQVYTPDATNLQIMMADTWDRFYMEGKISGQRTAQMNLAYLDEDVIRQSVQTITQGVAAQQDYSKKVNNGPQYNDPFIQTISAGDTKLSTTGGTLDTSSVVFGTNAPLIPATGTGTGTSSKNIQPADWSALAAADAQSAQNPAGFRSSLNSLP